ncbi:IS66 family transposase, partial [Parashewanella curva]
TAINYSLNQWEKLVRYLEDGRLSIDNNRVEREAKHFAIGRKNFLFCHTESGANSSAVLYSIVETCKVNGVNPSQYLTYLFEQLAHAPSDLEPLMPWNFDKD